MSTACANFGAIKTLIDRIFRRARRNLPVWPPLDAARRIFLKQNRNFFVFFRRLTEGSLTARKAEWKAPRVLHRGNTSKAIAHKTYIRVIASLVILNAHAQDKIINNDPVLNRKLAGHFMDDSIHSLAVTAGAGTAASGDIVFDARKIVVIDHRISNLSRAT